MSASQPTYALALDFGGTKLTSALVDVDSGKIEISERQPTPAAQGAEASLKVMIQAGEKILEKSHLTPSSLLGIGISFGGPVSRDRKSVLHSHHVADWDSYPLADHVARVFGLPTYMDNDGNAAALGEWYFGAGRGADNMIYIQVSTGVGAGMVLGRQLYRGQGLAAEFGHTTVMVNGPECTCGKHGCVESVTAGWALARDGKVAYARASADSPLRRLTGADPQGIDARLVFDAYRQGDPLAKEFVDRAFYYLGLGISNSIILVDPQIVVVGGGISHAWDVMYPGLQAGMADHLQPMFRNRARVEPSALNGVETLLGAALLAKGL